MTVGEACRRLIASQMVGLPGLVNLIRHDDQASDYYIHGYWDNLNSTALRFAVLSGMASRPVDALLLEILKDNRLAGKLEALEMCMLDEFDWLTRLPASTWEALANMVGEDATAASLRSECFLCAHVSATFLNFRCLRLLKEYPWRLCTGSAAESLASLAALDAPPPGADDTTVKIHHMLAAGVGREKLANVVLGGNPLVNRRGGAGPCQRFHHAALAPHVRFEPSLPAGLHPYTQAIACRSGN